MVTPKKIIMKDLELADKEIARLRKENKELEKENKELRKENERLQNFVDDLLDKMNNIKIVYVEFEKAETEYNKKLAALDKLIMNR